ncbi:hypothetical protein DZB84_04445 [Bacillus sp. HNG]|nr:hypothetical protein DZB84_04445 [Bacillus sp. HNG]
MKKSYHFVWWFKPQLNNVQASGGCHDFSKEIFRANSKKFGRKYAKAYFIMLFYILSFSDI